MQYVNDFFSIINRYGSIYGLVILPIILGLLEFVLLISVIFASKHDYLENLSVTNYLLAFFLIIASRIYIYNLINRSINNIRHNISKEKLNNILMNRTHLEKDNTGSLLAIVLTESDNLCTFLIMQLAFSLSYISSAIGLIIVASYLDLSKTFILFLFGGTFMFSMIVPMLAILALYGNKRVEFNEKRFQSAEQILTHGEMINSYKVNKVFLNNYAQSSFKFNNFLTKIMTATMFPRVFLETAIFLFYVYFMFSEFNLQISGKENNILLVAVLLKLVPHMQNIINTLSKVSLGKESLKRLEVFNNIVAGTKKVDNSCNLDKPFKLKITSNINYLDLKYPEMDIHPGKINFITGRSGAGKSTLLRVLMGNLDGFEAQIVQGKQLKTLDLDQVTLFTDFGYLQQQPTLCDDSLYNNIVFYRKSKNYTDKHIAELLIECGFKGDELTMLMERLHEPYISNLSGGQIQRICFARALLDKPRVLFLDEPLSALDEINRQILMVSLRKYVDWFGATVFFVTHDEKAISKADNEIRL